MPLEGLRWSRDSGSALYNTSQTAVLGRAGGVFCVFVRKINFVSNKIRDHLPHRAVR